MSEEVDVVSRTTTDQTGDQLPLAEVTPVLNERAILALQHLVARQRVDAAVVDYAVRIARATRDWPGIAVGSGSRGPDRAGARGQGGGADGGAILRPARRCQSRSRSRPCATASRLSADAQLDGRQADDLLAVILDATAAPRL